jgi:hypothetical protein
MAGSVNFAGLFAATDTAYGVSGTITDSGTVSVCTMIFDEIGGAIQTADGLLVPEGDCSARITKTYFPSRPNRGATIYDGTQIFDVVNPAQDGASRDEWILTLRRRF